MPNLSEAALALFRLHVERHGDILVDALNRPVYRELERAGVMRAVNTFAGGPDSAYRLTREGFDRKAELRREIQIGIDQADRGQVSPFDEMTLSESRVRGREHIATRKTTRVKSNS